ncbi:MAG TPA: arsenic resistance N-acetyltransferase ArsN2 [Gammaproteobacteria bacterium]
MTTAGPEFRTARADDPADIRALLKHAGLPFEDLQADAMPDFVVLRGAHGELLATGGIERYGEDGLLRSVAVSDVARGTGLGKAIAAAMERHARAKGIGSLYLLTTTAAAFFPRLGYEVFERHAVPAAVAKSAEFVSLCPASAVCLKKNLEQAP